MGLAEASLLREARAGKGISVDATEEFEPEVLVEVGEVHSGYSYCEENIELDKTNRRRMCINVQCFSQYWLYTGNATEGEWPDYEQWLTLSLLKAIP